VLSVSLNMDTIEYRAVIKFFAKEGLTPNKIHSKLIKFMGTLLLRFQQLRNGLPSLTLRRLMSYIYGAPILDVSTSHTTTQHSR